jgi:thioredoxin-like negative regulator of GroEL
VVTVTQENFDATVLKSEVPILLDFWAVWCEFAGCDPGARRARPTS